MSVTNDVVGRLLALNGSEREISPRKRPSVRFSRLTDADINFFEKGIRTYASFNKALGHRCQSLWLSIQELEKPSCPWIG